MPVVVAEQSISLDGFSAGANQSPANPMGDGGQRLHEWLSATSSQPDANVIDAYWSRIGAVILGKRMFDNGLESWDGENPWGVPAFVLSHDQRAQMSKNGDIQFTFVADGIEGALEQARAIAGDRDVAIADGAKTIQQSIVAGQLDELHVHLVPIVLGSGVRLLEGVGCPGIEIQPGTVVGSSGVTHLRYRLVR